jgi:tetratricopeptide (TPR) repeat protein
MALSRTHLRLKFLLIAAGLWAGLPATGLAQKDQAPLPQVSDEISDLLNTSVRPANDAKDWDKVLSFIETGLRKVAPDSYDAALLNQVKAQTCFQKNNLSEALIALEKSLEIDDRKHYFQEKPRLESLYLVAQLNFQEATTSKDFRKQAAFYAKSDQALGRWMQGVKDYTPENILFIAMLYFYRAQPPEIAGAEQKTDMAMMENALIWTNKGLRASARPRDTFYQLKLAELYQLNRYEDAAELLELLVKQKPDNRNHWQQLAHSYLQLASNATDNKDDKAAYRYNIRAILAIERAQKLGIMSTPKDNYNLVGIYFNIGQFEMACDLLDKGLRDGAIEPTRQNWELLANSYQQLHRELKAVDTLKQAAKVFPESGQIDYQIAQIYFTIDKPKEAFGHIKLCIKKGGTEKRHMGWLFYAYLALDLKEYDDALKAAGEAAKFPEAATEAAKMQEAIKATLQDRENRLQSSF